MAVFEALVAPEVEADSAKNLSVVVVADPAIHKECDTSKWGLIFQADDVEVFSEPVLSLCGNHQIIHGINGSKKACGGEVTLSVDAGCKGGQHASVIVVVAHETTDGEFVKIELAFDAGQKVVEVSAVRAANCQTHKRPLEGLRVKKWPPYPKMSVPKPRA